MRWRLALASNAWFLPKPMNSGEVCHRLLRGLPLRPAPNGRASKKPSNSHQHQMGFLYRPLTIDSTEYRGPTATDTTWCTSLVAVPRLERENRCRSLDVGCRLSSVRHNDTERGKVRTHHHLSSPGSTGKALQLKWLMPGAHTKSIKRLKSLQ